MDTFWDRTVPSNPNKTWTTVKNNLNDDQFIDFDIELTNLRKLLEEMKCDEKN